MFQKSVPEEYMIFERKYQVKWGSVLSHFSFMECRTFAGLRFNFFYDIIDFITNFFVG